MKSRFSGNKPNVAVRLDDEDRAILEALAKLERLSNSDIIRRAVRAYAKDLGVVPQPQQPTL
jgi:uncharacterized protein (DUF1778 family)